MAKRSTTIIKCRDCGIRGYLHTSPCGKFFRVACVPVGVDPLAHCWAGPICSTKKDAIISWNRMMAHEN